MKLFSVKLLVLLIFLGLFFTACEDRQAQIVSKLEILDKMNSSQARGLSQMTLSSKNYFKIQKEELQSLKIAYPSQSDFFDTNYQYDDEQEVYVLKSSINNDERALVNGMYYLQEVKTLDFCADVAQVLLKYHLIKDLKKASQQEEYFQEMKWPLLNVIRYLPHLKDVQDFTELSAGALPSLDELEELDGRLLKLLQAHFTALDNLKDGGGLSLASQLAVVISSLDNKYDFLTDSAKDELILYKGKSVTKLAAKFKDSMNLSQRKGRDDVEASVRAREVEKGLKEIFESSTDKFQWQVKTKRNSKSEIVWESYLIIR